MTVVLLFAAIALAMTGSTMRGLARGGLVASAAGARGRTLVALGLAAMACLALSAVTP